MKTRHLDYFLNGVLFIVAWGVAALAASYWGFIMLRAACSRPFQLF